MTYLKTFTLGAALLLSACATQYNKEMGLTGGSQVSMMTPTRAVVSFSGNGYTSGDTTRQYVMLRAAELTYDSGYTHFYILDGAADERLSSMTTWTYSPYAYGGGYASTSVISKPKNSLEIQMLQGNPEPGNPNIYSAAEVINTIRPTLTKAPSPRQPV